MNVRSALCIVLCAFAAPAQAGGVAGRVEVLQKGGRKLADLSDVIVYLEGVREKPAPARTTVMMKGKAFLPRVAVVSVGSTVEFPNQDPIFHNVFSVSGQNRFDLDLYKRPKSGSWTFQAPGVVRVYCNIHPQMSAVVVVVDNPFFSKVQPDGTFTIENVPAGRHRVKAWHERAGEASVEVAVPDKGTATAGPLRLDATAWKRQQHKNKFGKDYSSDEKY